MAGSVNKVILVGNLGKDPEVRNLQDGSKVVNLTLATSENWTDKASGERKERTEWHRVVIFNDRLGEVAEKYTRKGSKVYIEGSLQTRKWTDQASGQERYSTEVVITRFKGEITLLDRAGGDQQSSGGGSYGGGNGNGGGSYRPEPRPAAPAAAKGGWDSGRGGDLDDEIPF